MKIAITGASGLLGWHAAARLHALNCAARWRKETPPYDLSLVDHATFLDPDRLAAALNRADAVLHFAGVNLGPEDEVEAANPAIARQLVQACAATASAPHIVYANSTHAARDTGYGRSKRIAGEILTQVGGGFTDIILPHIFGECARPYYNNVTATLIDQLWNDESVTINPEGHVDLLHAGEAAQLGIDAALSLTSGTIEPVGRPMPITELYDRLRLFHTSYSADIFPQLCDPFDVALFNSYRTGGFPAFYPRLMAPKADARGILFETSRSLGPSQSFISSTHRGQRRGDHFHIDLVERFLVVSGRALISVRKVLTDEVHRFEVSGDEPVAIDMPPLHTHNIVNNWSEPVITYFWSNALFNPQDPDTYADPVESEDWACQA